MVKLRGVTAMRIGPMLCLGNLSDVWHLKTGRW